MNKEKYTLEYDMKSVPVMLLWNYIATPPGLSQWFADKVIQEGKEFTFVWNKSEVYAAQIGVRLGSFIRFRWEEDDESVIGEKYFLELKISVSEITENTTLSITDFAFDDEKESSRELWDHQIDILRRMLGCI